MIATPGQIAQRGSFYFQLAGLVTAGVPIIQAMEMARNSGPRRQRAPLGAVLDRLQSGATLTEAFQASGKWMPVFDLTLISAGEQSGRLDAVFRSLGDHYQDRALLLRKMLSSLAYPVFILHFAVLVFPTRLLTGLFLNNGLEAFLQHKLLVLLPAYVVVFLLLFALQGGRGKNWRALMERLLHPVPLLGGARFSLALSRLSGALEALINAGVPIIRAWGIAADASGSHRMQRYVRAALPQMESGLTPSEILRQSRFFPELFQNLYASGELSGQLDTTLHRLHVHYREESTHKFQAIAEWTPKIIFLFVALGIGYQVISFYSGYFDQINKLGF